LVGGSWGKAKIEQDRSRVDEERLADGEEMKKQRKIRLKSALRVSVVAMFLLLTHPFSVQAAGSQLVDRGDGILQEEGSGKMWQAKRSRRFNNNDEVKHYLLELNSGSFGDWRLPTRNELYDFFLLFDLHKTGNISIQLEGAYWLQGPHGEPKIGSWETGDQCGPTRMYRPGLSGHVRAVRP